MPNVLPQPPAPEPPVSDSPKTSIGRGSAWRRWLGICLLGLLVVFGIINFRELLSYGVTLHKEWLFPFSAEYVLVDDTAKEVEVFPSGLYGFKVDGFYFGRDDTQAMFFLWVDNEWLSGIRDGRFSKTLNSRFFFVNTALAVDSDYPSWSTAKIKKGACSADLISLSRSTYIPFSDGQIGTLQGSQGEIGGFSAFGSSVSTLLSGLYCKAISFNSPFSNVGLPPYLFPLSPSKNHINNCGRNNRELCNDGKSVIAGHWGLGIVLCVIGFWCCCKMYLMPDGLSDHVYFTRAFIWQSLFLVFFGVGIYGIISSTFKDCETKPNAEAHREPPHRVHSVYAESQRGGDAVQRKVRC